jgi:predicted metal-dependent phosphoesterase TrpH
MLDSVTSSTRFDLHLHSLRSDGRYPPEEVLRRCALAGLDVIALTDHDLPTAIPPGQHLVEGRTITVLAGAEVSGVHQGREHHLLVYFAGEVPQGFRDFCTAQCVARARRYEQARGNLGLSGIEPAQDEAVCGQTALTRHHLARQLVERGHVQNLREAFALYLSESRKLVPPIELTFTEALRIARAAGGITSWAHPPATMLQECLPAFVAAGLHGIEGLRPQVTSADRRKYRNAARRFGLLLTGGSDWHGWGDDHDLGLFRVEAHEITGFIERLRAA